MVHAPRSSDSRCLQSRQECADGNASVIAADSSASANASDVAAARLQLDSLCPLQAPARLPFAPYASSSRLRCLATSKLSASRNRSHSSVVSTASGCAPFCGRHGAPKSGRHGPARIPLIRTSRRWRTAVTHVMHGNRLGLRVSRRHRPPHACMQEIRLAACLSAHPEDGWAWVRPGGILAPAPIRDAMLRAIPYRA